MKGTFNESSEQCENQVLVPLWEKAEPYFEFLKEDRYLMVAAYDPQRIAPDDKRQPCHNVPVTLNSLDRIFSDAIEVSSPTGKVRRVSGILGAIFSFGMFAGMLFLDIKAVSSVKDSGDNYAPFLILFIFPLLFLLLSVWFVRASLFLPTDQPIIFNRKTRVVSFMRVRLPHLIKFWVPMRAEYKSFSWDAAN